MKSFARSLALIFLTSLATFAADKEARVTVLVHDVKLLPEDADPRAATLNETVHEDTAVRTGDSSRSELTFGDLTITRLGSNTIFSFNRAGRSVQLNSGAILVRVPKNSGGAEMKTSACSVAIAGTTIVLEAARAGRNKLYVLEGAARMALNKRPNEWRNAGPGQMLDVPGGAGQMPEAKNFDVNNFMRTNPLITDFPPLPSRDLIYASNPNAPVYASQPVDNGPPRPQPPFRRPPPVFPPGGGGNPPPSTGNPTPPPDGTGGGKVKVPRPKGLRPVGVKQPTPTPTPPPVILRKLPPPKPTPTPRLKRKPPPPPIP